MTKQEQIEEMTKIIQHEEEIYPCEDDVIVRIAFALYKIQGKQLCIDCDKRKIQSCAITERRENTQDDT